MGLGQQIEQEFNAQFATVEERKQAHNKKMGGIGWLSKNLAEIAEKSGQRWLVADYEAGDVVIHSPYIIHASTANQDQHGRIRLSTDIRYQPASELKDNRWDNDWSPFDRL